MAGFGAAPAKRRGMKVRPLCLILALLAVCSFSSESARPTAPSPTRVTLNRDGVAVVNGRKMFPIGFTMPPPPDGKTPSGKDAIEELRDAGATMLRTGPMGVDWS